MCVYIQDARVCVLVNWERGGGRGEHYWRISLEGNNKDKVNKAKKRKKREEIWKQYTGRQQKAGTWGGRGEGGLDMGVRGGMNRDICTQ
jgi:hypothetical protein